MALIQRLQGLCRPMLLALGSNSVKCKASRQSLAKITSTTQPLFEKQEVSITFVKASGERITAKGREGDSILDIVVNNEVDLDGYGACEGTLTCSTCHLIFPKKVYDNLPNKPSEEELDMLDLAYELTDTSRLGCQVVMTKELDGLEVQVPATINDART
ncbi:adrenodoxin [Harpegnathos saltator]|uniref:Adrenodoxin, mitochondrial n=1 Tax=Harpegnathos saltator TaxID=610380 RepID=E2B3D3_HARSA|nr:adrenodoxin [Harpegnathos saltator]XP_011136471.1 adrenodoxin [Harpegnathos saltator]EFN89811.1 Adrenodoxin, mitochondrial [Harpegnathos saltator]